MIVIPMAGASSRFARAGYDVPKWRLPLGAGPLFDSCLRSFEEQFASELFVVLHRDEPGVREFVASRLEVLGVERSRLVAVPSPTRGQADTVALGLERLDADEDEALTVFNIDTVRHGYRPDPLLDVCDGLVECFEGDGDHWSFVRLGDPVQRRAAQVTEKVRVSNLCSDGLYWFRSVRLFREMFALEESSPSAGELYIAPLYQRMIDAGLDVRYSVVGRDKLTFSGTPEEYEAARRVTT